MEDTIFPGGNMEIIFNLGDGGWQTAPGGEFLTTPPVELWGQITQPLPVRSFGKNTMLGAKFFSHTAAYFLHTEVWEFNDQVADLRDLLGRPVKELHARLLETPVLSKRVGLLEGFLVRQLSVRDRKSDRIAMVGEIMKDMQENAYTDRILSTASQYNITPRYLQKLFLQYTGFTPKLYTKISRFQQSLKLIAKHEGSFTSIAYDCGYFDQAHFIRDFKSFTGMTPSAYSAGSFPVSLVVSPQ
jgi:AraC-like DNA-binding protein